jgi:hypothetical protein
MLIIGRLRNPEDGRQSRKRDGHLTWVRYTDTRVPLVYLVTRCVLNDDV